MSAGDRFATIAPQMLVLARGADVSLSLLLRHQLSNFDRWDLPLGWTDGAGAWVLAIPKKLDSPNRYRAHWTMLNAARAKWEQQVWVTVTKALHCASVAFLRELGRAPRCTVQMNIRIVRLVPSARQFIKDDDNRAYSAKPVHDSLKRVGLIKEDRREWLRAAPIVQDVSPIENTPVTVVFLWPSAVALSLSPAGDPDVQRRRSAPLHARQR